MSCACVLLAAALASASATEADHAHYIRLHKEWLRMHDAGERQTHLIIDPRASAMWIENQGEVCEGYVVDLPRGFRWYAYHVARRGITKRSFPLRLTMPRPDFADASEVEQLSVVALAEEEGFRLTFSATRSGTGFHVGSGSRTGDVTIHLPAATSAPANHTSFVAPQFPQEAPPQDFVQLREFAVRVERRSTAADTE